MAARCALADVASAEAAPAASAPWEEGPVGSVAGLAAGMDSAAAARPVAAGEKASERALRNPCSRDRNRRRWSWSPRGRRRRFRRWHGLRSHLRRQRLEVLAAAAKTVVAVEAMAAVETAVGSLAVGSAVVTKVAVVVRVVRVEVAGEMASADEVAVEMTVAVEMDSVGLVADWVALEEAAVAVDLPVGIILHGHDSGIRRWNSCLHQSRCGGTIRTDAICPACECSETRIAFSSSSGSRISDTSRPGR